MGYVVTRCAEVSSVSPWFHECLIIWRPSMDESLVEFAEETHCIPVGVVKAKAPGNA